MIDLQQAAASIYGNTAMPGASAPPASAATVDEKAAASLWGENAKPDTPVQQAEPDGPTPEEIEAERSAKAAEVTLQNTFGSLQRSIVDAAPRLNLTPEAAEVNAREFAIVFKTFGVSPQEADYLTEVGICAVANPPDAETVKAWTKSAREELAKEFSPSGAGQALADANTYLARHPKLAQWLGQHKLNYNPNVVLSLAKTARRARTGG